MINSYEKAWDNNVISYNKEKYDWYGFWLEKFKEKFPKIDSLENIHNKIQPNQIFELIRHCQKISLSEEFIKKIDEYYEEILNFVDYEFMIQKSANIRLVIPKQAESGRLLSFHKDSWVGNGMGIKNVWTPITDSFDTNSIQVLDSNTSDVISQRCQSERWSNEKLQAECLNSSENLNIKQGECLLFASNNIHGNVNNETDITRVSMDARILPKGGFYFRKLPGGYFRFKGEIPQISLPDTKRTWVSYAGWNSKFSQHIPVHMQRYQIEKYCDKIGIKINDYQFENEFMEWYPNLEKYINDEKIQGIVCFSLFGLPDDPFLRQKLLMSAIKQNKELIFVNEDIYFKNNKDLEYIKRIYEYYNTNESPKETLGHI